MRILYIHQYFSTRQGSGGTRSYEFARRWVQAGHQVTMITGTSARGDLQSLPQRVITREIEGIRVFYIRTDYSNYLSFRQRLLTFLRFMFWATWVGLRHTPSADVVFATSTPLTVGIPGYVISRLRRIPFVFEIRDLWPDAPIQLGVLRSRPLILLARALERFLYRAAQHIVTLSPGMFASLAERGIPSAKLSMIPNCSDLDLFQPREPDPSWLARLKLEGKFVASYAGAMGMANGLDVVIETARILQVEGEREIHFLLIGDGKERPSLEERAQKYGLPNVTFLSPLPKEELAHLLPISNICLTIFAPYPILETCSPNKFFDALALGRPVLINFGGWMKELLEEYQAGVAVPSSDPAEIAVTLRTLREQPERLQEMGRRARALAEERFDRDKLARQLEAILKMVVEGTSFEDNHG
ncbi:MAG: glycosyltransferase family 4 protein [Anaerolineae bacterium]|nr:glycosyltransferase family 4 protein [Anaerolineae bacterium]